MHVQVEENDVDMNASGYGLNGYFVGEDDTKNMNDSEWEDMVRNWIDVWEDTNIEEDELEDAQDNMERGHALMHDEDNKENDEENEEYENGNEHLPPTNEGQSTITY